MVTWTKPVVVPRRQVDGDLWRNWMLSSAGAGLLSAVITLGLCGENGFLLSGFVVAPILGVLQVRVLRPYLPQLSSGVWVLATSLGGGLGWALGFWTLGSLLLPIVDLPGVVNGQDGTLNLGNALLVLLAMLLFTGISGAILGLGFGLGQRPSINDLIMESTGQMASARLWLLSNIGAWVIAGVVILLAFAPVYAGLVRVPDGIIRLGIGLLWTLAVTISGAVTGSTLQQLLRRTPA